MSVALSAFDMSSHRSHALSWSWWLFVIGVVLLGGAIVLGVDGFLAARSSQREFQTSLAAVEQPVRTVSAGPRPSVREGELLGLLTIPKWDLAVTIREGVDGRTLASGAGHIPGTALPGRDGNVALAAHRDTYFRALRDVVVGDEVRLTTREGERTYSVVSTEIVRPEDIESLAPSRDSRLTLVTCYPFSFIGRAPSRFLVRAVEVPGSPIASDARTSYSMASRSNSP